VAITIAAVQAQSQLGQVAANIEPAEPLEDQAAGQPGGGGG